MANDLVKQIEKQVVHTESLFAVDNSFNDERFMKVRIAVMHSGINRNNSRFSKETIENAKGTFSNIPILAEVQKFTDDDGNEYLDYTTHAMHLEDDAFDSNKQRTIYDEQVVGVIPETNNFELVYDEETQNYYANCDALLYRDYGNYVCDILESKGGITDVSAEILCDECSFSAKDKCLDVGKMIMSGVTLLGEAVTPGMAKAHAEIFAINEDSKQNQLIKIMQELTSALDNYIQMNAMKGGKQVNKFEELMQKYNKSIEDISFAYKGLSDEELETAFAEAFDEIKIKKVEDDEVPAVPETPEVENPTPNPEETPSPEPTPEPEVEPQPEPEAPQPEETEPEVDPSLNSLQCSVTIGEKTTNFSVSMNAKIEALSNLVNDTYADDMTWYCIEAFDDPKQVVMIDCWSGRAYRQDYKVKDDVFSLKGDRVSVHSMWVTDDEQKAFDKMKADFAETSEKLAKYEAEPEKMQILESEDYSSISDKAEFVELKKQENHFDLTIDELKKSADDIILNYAKKGSLSFSMNETKNTVGVKVLPIVAKNTKRSRYGGLGKKED